MTTTKGKMPEPDFLDKNVTLIERCEQWRDYAMDVRAYCAGVESLFRKATGYTVEEYEAMVAEIKETL